MSLRPVPEIVRELTPSLGAPEQGLTGPDELFFEAGNSPLMLLLHHPNLTDPVSETVRCYGLVYVPNGKYPFFYPAVVISDDTGGSRAYEMAPYGLQENKRNRLDVKLMTVADYKKLYQRLVRMARKLTDTVDGPSD